MPEKQQDRSQHSLFFSLESTLNQEKVLFPHGVDAQCISKGKEHELYEFENKVSITRTGSGVIVGALSFRNDLTSTPWTRLSSEWRS